MAHEEKEWAIKRLKNIQMQRSHPDDIKALAMAITELQISIDNQ